MKAPDVLLLSVMLACCVVWCAMPRRRTASREQIVLERWLVVEHATALDFALGLYPDPNR